MFTGIVAEIGLIEKITKLESGLKLRIAAGFDPQSIDIGASIACAGVCLTVVSKADDQSSDKWFELEAWNEALQLTTIGSWKVGSRINLERALRLGDELGGHMVSGHADGTAEVINIEQQGDATRFTLVVPAHLARFIAPKGSVTLDGTSLTVNGVEGQQFDVLLIRHTLQVTTWGDINVGDHVNIEIDTMARYAARLAQFDAE